MSDRDDSINGSLSDAHDDVAMLVALITTGPFAMGEDPVLLIGPDGDVRARNLAGAALSVDAARRAELAPLIEAARAEGRPATAVLGGGDSGATSVSVLPVGADGSLLVQARDVSVDRNLRSALVDSRQRYRDLVEISADLAWETDAQGKFTFISPRGGLGWTADDLVGRRADGFLAAPAGAAMQSPFVTREACDGVEIGFRRPDGSEARLETAAAPLFTAGGDWQGARGVCRDVSRERQRDLELARAGARQRLTAYIMRAIRDETDPDQMLKVAAEAVFRGVEADSCAVFRILPGAGLTLAASIGGDLPDGILEAVREAITDRREPVIETFDIGAVLAHQLSHHHEINGAVVLWRSGDEADWNDREGKLLSDLSDQLGIALHQAAAHQHLTRLSSTDAMTGLLNRRAFDEAIGTRLASGPPTSGVLTYVDLDNFKKVNDTRGHQVGDQALIHLSDILKRQVRPGDLVARLGGDEFALWMEDVDGAGAPSRAEWIIETGKELLQYSGSPDYPVGLSIGMAVSVPGSSETREQLIERADAVMYQVKHGGKGWYRISDPANPSSETSTVSAADSATPSG